MSDPVQVSQICDGKWPAGEIWTGSDTIRVSQIRDGKWPAEGGFSVTNLGNLNRIRHDQGWLADGGFSVTNLGNLVRIRQDQGFPLARQPPQLE